MKRDLLENLAPTALQDLLESRETVASPENEDRLVSLVKTDNVDPLEARVLLDLKDLMDLQDQEDHRVNAVCVVDLDDKDHEVPSLVKLRSWSSVARS